MFSSYRGMKSYPHYPYPSFPVAPPAHAVEAQKCPYLSRYPCFFDGHQPYSSQGECNGCCIHDPSRHFHMPPYPPAQHPYYAHYPHPHPNYLYPYFVPPFNESNRVWSNKDQGKQHCCGCPNHISNQNDKSILKTQEGCNKDGTYDDSNSLKQLSNYNHPIIWFPPKVSNESKSLPQPGFWNTWHPLVQGSEVNKEDKGGDDKNQWCSPTIWMPSQACDAVSGQTEKDAKEIRASPKIEEMPQSKSRIIQVKHPTNDGDDMITIPVKQLKSLDCPQPTKCVRRAQDVEADKSMSSKQETKMDNASSRQELKSQKSFKLPPVCLRVDPLPKRKNGNGSSRSRSPTSGKGNEEDAKKIEPFDMGEKPDNVGSKREVIEVQEKVEGSNKNIELAETSKRSSSVKVTPIDKRLSDIKEDTVNSTGIVSLHARKNDKNISEGDAVIIIQSAYRGFQVRRWEPLKKLKEIRKIHTRVSDIRETINALGSASWHPPLDSKEKVAISEAIMNLLLQLDTIQGLHPSVRETRKSVAQEIVCLQEKLDALANEGTTGGKCNEDEPGAIKQEESLSNETSDAGNHIPRDCPCDVAAEQSERQEQNQAPCVEEHVEASQLPLKEEVRTEANVDFDCLIPPTENCNARNLAQVEEVDCDSQLSDNTIVVEEGSLLDKTQDTLHKSHSTEILDQYMEVPVESLPKGCGLVDLFDIQKLLGDEELHMLPRANTMVSKEHTSAPPETSSQHPILHGLPKCDGVQVDGGLKEEENSPHTETKTTELLDCEMNAMNALVDEGESQLQQLNSEGLALLCRDSRESAVKLEWQHKHEYTDFDDHTNAEKIPEFQNAYNEEMRISLEKDGNMYLQDEHDRTWKEHSHLELGNDGCASTTIDNNLDDVSLVADDHSPVIEEEPECLDTRCLLKTPLNNDAKKLVEQNLQLRKMLQELLVNGKEQMEVISSLSGRVKDLERKLAPRRRLKLNRSRLAARSFRRIDFGQA